MEGVREPNMWRRPRAKVYDYNQQFGGTYYLPMLEYLDKKERQGIFFERPTERVHFPDPLELTSKQNQSEDYAGSNDVMKFLTKAYANKIKEQNMATAHTQSVILRHSKDASVLKPRLTAAMLRDHYAREIMLMRVSSNF